MNRKSQTTFSLDTMQLRDSSNRTLQQMRQQKPYQQLLNVNDKDDISHRSQFKDEYIHEDEYVSDDGGRFKYGEQEQHL